MTTTTSTRTVLQGAIKQPQQSVFQNKANSDFNAVELKRKYDEERDKRLRHNNGLEQYRAIEGDLAYLLKDPNSVDRLDRKPIVEDCEAVVIGGGYGAQLVAIELSRTGIEDVRMIEKGADFGGTWYWNQYPGAQCDIESYVYMPLLDDTGYMPTQKYAPGPELLSYSKQLGHRYGLYEKALFQTEVTRMDWQEERARWDVQTDRGDHIYARFVIPAAGPLHRPKLPNLPGLGTFKGHTFHTSRWDHEYTGGDRKDSSAPLEGLRDKRVGVIGTGATAVQIVPHLGRWAKHLFVFQRTPSSIDVRGNRATDPEWVHELGKGWHQKRMDNFNIIVNGGVQEEDLVSDGWTDILRQLTTKNAVVMAGDSDPRKQAEIRQRLDFEKMEQIRARVDEVVRDPKTAESLKPYYNQFCKRPCFHDDYLPTFNRDNVTLIDTQGKGVEAITEKGVIANGQETELDCLIYATGFETATPWTQKSGIKIFGRDGISLDEKWYDGPSTLHGHSTRSFPNCFFVSTIQAGLSPNFLHITAFQAEHISYMIRRCREQNVRTVEPIEEAEDSWVRTIVESGQRRKAFRMQCTPGYYNNEGQTSEALDRQASYGGGALEYMDMLRKWREEDKLAGLEVQHW